MTFKAKTALSLALVAATTLTSFSAFAGERWHHHRRPVIVERHSNGGELLAAGVLGLAAGAVIAGIASQPEPIYREPAYRPVYTPGPDNYYYPPAPVYEAPPVRYATYEPWSPEWYRYCADRYRSFDPSSGTFMGYDGVRHFCVAN